MYLLEQQWENVRKWRAIAVATAKPTEIKSPKNEDFISLSAHGVPVPFSDACFKRAQQPRFAKDLRT